MHLLLPSNASMDLYPSNTISNYTVHLPKQIDLNGSYEVAIAEIFYTNSWFNVETGNNYWFYYRNGEVAATTYLAPGFYEHPKYAIAEILSDLKKCYAIESQRVKTRELLPVANPSPFALNLSFNNHTQLVEIQVAGEKNFYINMSEKLQQALGLDSRDYRQHGTFVGSRMVDFNPVHSLYVYTDLVAPRMVGDVMAPLLGIVPIQGSSGDNISIRYNKLQYQPVLKHNITDINISIRDDKGQLVRFRKGRAIVTLHLRKTPI